jgi:cyclophilin family peptidyl-prolyl cis-trans isomerase
MKNQVILANSRRCAGIAAVVLLWANSLQASTFVRMDYNFFNANLRYSQSVFIELFDDRPITRNNFLQYVDAGKFDQTLMHRLVPGFVLQGGGFYEDRVAMPAPLNLRLAEDEVDLDGNPNTNNPTIANEFGNSPFRSNVKGTLAMAKTAAGPNSATNQFFFNLADNSANLNNQNGGFTVFAQVVGSGMSLIDSFSGLNRINLNNDVYTQVNNTSSPNHGDVISQNPDQVRDFAGTGPFEEVPYIGNALLRLEAANRTDYFSSTSTTNIPAANLTLTNPIGFVEAGASFTGTGKFVVGTGKTLSLNHGANIGRPVEVSGILDPGLQVGSVSVSSYSQLAAGRLEMQLAGETAGSLYDQLNVTGAASLSGQLRVGLLSSFKPSAGDTFNLITAGSLTGSFSTASLPVLRSGLAWDLQQSATGLKLVVLPDYNNSGTVDAGDLTIWQTHYGSTTNLLADGDGDGRVTGRDFLLWQRFHGETKTLPPAPAITAVPEPGTGLLALFALVVGVSRRSRR